MTKFFGKNNKESKDNNDSFQFSSEKSPSSIDIDNNESHSSSTEKDRHFQAKKDIRHESGPPRNIEDKKSSSLNPAYLQKIDNRSSQKSHNSRIPIFALAIFLSVFLFSIMFILLAVMGAQDISIFGIVLLPHDIYYNFLNGIFTTTEITNFWSTNPLSFFLLIAIFLSIIGVLIKFLSAFREPVTEFDSEQTDGSVTYFNFTKLYARVRFIFIKPSDDQNMDTVRDFMGTVFSYKTDSKNTNAVYCVPDKRHSKTNDGNFFLEFPECFDISTLRNYMSEHSWITLATNLAMSITMTILIVGTLLNVALNIITQSQLNPYMIFGVTSWISLSAVISISVVMVWALREIKGSYGVFRIIKVTKTPLDVDRYIVIPYYHDGINGAEIDTVVRTFLSYNKKSKANGSTASLPAVVDDYSFSNNFQPDSQPMVTDATSDSDDYVPEIHFNEEDINFDLNKTHTKEFYTAEIEQLKTKNKNLEMEKDRALLMVTQLADDNTNLKKAIRARKSIDYSNIRSMTSLQERPAPQQTPTYNNNNTPSNSSSSGSGNSYVLPLIIVAILGVIAVYWASISFDPTQFMIIIVAGLLLVVCVVAVVGLLILRHYLNESSQGKRINFG